MKIGAPAVDGPRRKMRRPRRTGERRGRGGELSRTLRGRRRGSPPRSRGRTLRAARGGSDAERCGDPHGGRDHARTVFRRLTPTGGGADARTRSGVIPTGGGTHLHASLGARPHRTGGRRGLEEDYSWAFSAWRPFRQNFSLGRPPFTQRDGNLPVLPDLKLSDFSGA